MKRYAYRSATLRVAFFRPPVFPGGDENIDAFVIGSSE
jgi:hypothetical protein